MAVRLKKTLFKLLKEDYEFRYALAGFLGMDEVLKRLDRHEAELVKLREDMIAGFRRHDEELAALRAETNKLREDMIAWFRRHDEELAALRAETNKLREDMMMGFRRHDEELTALRAETNKLREDMMMGFKRHDEELAALRAETNKLREDMIAGFRRHDEELAALRAETNKLREDMMMGFKRHDEELAALRAETNKLREDMMMGFRRHDEELTALRAETNKLREDMMMGFKRHDEELVRLRMDMNRGFELVNRRLDALGARWGVMAESAFREGLKGVLEKEIGLSVERWTAFDEEGVVYGFPSPVEIDLAVRDGKTVLVEVKSSVRLSDVSEFSRKVEFFSAKTGRRPDRKVMVAPYVDEEALKAAGKLGIEVYTKV